MRRKSTLATQLSNSTTDLIPAADLVLARQRRPRLRFVWQEEDDTADAIRAKIRDMIESGWAREGDHFVTLGWRPPEDEGATIEPAGIVFAVDCRCRNNINGLWCKIALRDTFEH